MPPASGLEGIGWGQGAPDPRSRAHRTPNPIDTPGSPAYISGRGWLPTLGFLWLPHPPPDPHPGLSGARRVQEEIRMRSIGLSCSEQTHVVKKGLANAALSYRALLLVGLAVSVFAMMAPFALAAGPARTAPAAPAPTTDGGEMVGVPWTGASGITETVDQIMARAKLVPAPAGNVVKESEKEGAEELQRPIQRLNPQAQAGAPATAIKDFRPMAPEAILAPQTVGTAFETERLF